MKIKNISVGDSVQIKKGKHLDYFKDDEICQVIDIDAGDKYGFDVLIDGQKGLDWVSHKHLKKPEPQLRPLDQSDDIAKELLEVDLSSELTGSELCRAMLERGDMYVMCLVENDSEPTHHFNSFKKVVYNYDDEEMKFCCIGGIRGDYAVPINNQGEPLTASEAGL